MATATGEQSADSQRNHLHMTTTTTNDSKRERRGRDIRLADTGVHATSQTDSTCGNTRSYSASVNVCRHLW
ncbi:hypothetical protein GQ42DRAFT_165496 [Ramicandelaber brevisporus]|nr:hypothetical protein GQ42DRAFT_165496 [Ramicandelaber brevisporus]